MKHEYEDIESTVQKYVTDQLSETEAIEFEEYFTDQENRDIAEMVSTTQEIQLGLENLEGDESILSASPASKFSPIGWIKNFLTSSVPIPVPAMILGGFVVATLFPVNRVDEQNDFVAYTRVHFVSDDTRTIGANDKLPLPFAIDLTGVSGPSLVTIKLAELRYKYYKVQLSNAADKKSLIWESVASTNLNIPYIDTVIPSSLKRENFLVGVEGSNDEIEWVSVKFCHFSEPC